MSNERIFEYIDDFSSGHEISDARFEVIGARYITTHQELARHIPVGVQPIRELGAMYQSMTTWAERVWQQPVENRDLWIMTPRFFVESDFHPFWRGLEIAPRLAGLFVQGTEGQIESMRIDDELQQELESMTPEERRVYEVNVVRDMDQFHRRRMDYLFEIASNREHEFYATALDALQVEAQHGNTQAAELLRRLGL